MDLLRKLFVPPRMREALPATDKEIVRGMVTVLLFAACATLIGAAKEMTIAHRYGVSPVVDAYQFLFYLAQWPLTVVSGVFTAALVPLVGRLQEDAAEELAVFRFEVLRRSLLTALVLLPLVVILLMVLVSSDLVALPPGVVGQALVMIKPMALALSCGLIAVTLGGWLLASYRHANTLLQALPALVVFFAVLNFTPTPELLAWSTAVGFLLYAVVSWVMLRPQFPWRRLFLTNRSPHWHGLLAGLGTLVAGQILISLVTVVDQFFAARLGVGSLSTFGYANRLAAVVLTIGALVISRGMLPTLARVSANDPQHVIAISMRFGSAVFGVGLIAALTGALIADWLVALLYERGQFLPQDTAAVSRLVRFSLLQVPFYLTSMVFVAALLAQKRFRGVMCAAALSIVAKVCIASALVQSFGLPGLLCATTLVYLLSSSFCALQLRFGWIAERPVR